MIHSIKLLKNEQFREKNRTYNSFLKSVTDSTVFITDDTEKIGYLPVGNLDTEQFRFSPWIKDKIIRESVLKDGAVQLDNKLSPYENIIYTNLLYGEYDCYIISGARGSGKTSTSRYILEHIRNKITDNKGFVEEIQINLNQQGNQDVDIVREQFIQEFYHKLRKVIYDFLKKYPTEIDHFLEHSKSDMELSEFLDLQIESELNEWKFLKEREKLNLFIMYIKNLYPNSRELTVRLMMRVIGFLNRTKPEKSECYFILLIDNIDNVPIASQFEIVGLVFGYIGISKIKCLIPVRRATFKRYHLHMNEPGGRGGHNFGFFHHHGHSPITIILARLLYWRNHSTKDPRTKDLPDSYLKAFQMRLDHVYETLTTKVRLKEVILSLSGRSTRLALELCQRLIVNDIIPFNQDAEYEDHYIRALLVSGPNNILQCPDSYVTNIFRNGLNRTSGEELSLLPIRILQYIASFQNNEDANCSIKLVEAIRSCNNWSDDEIVAALNKLLTVMKPLIWTDRKEGFDNLQDTLLSNDGYYLTEAGDGYLSRLIHELTYLQESFLPLLWDSDLGIPFELNVLDTAQRFEMLTLCLRAFHEQDVQQLDRALDWLALGMFPICVSAHVIYKVAESIFRIHQKDSGPYKIQLFEKWITLLDEVLDNPFGYPNELKFLRTQFIGELRRLGMRDIS
jgi:hypothetical protein